jgi:hypothetical protein
VEGRVAFIALVQSLMQQPNFLIQASTPFYGFLEANWRLPGVYKFPGSREAFTGTSVAILEALEGSGIGVEVQKPRELLGPHRPSNQRISYR